MEDKVPLSKKISQTIKCLLEQGKLAAYENELNDIVLAIYNAGCGINCNEYIPSSHLSQTPYNEMNKPLMQIGLLNRKQPLDIVWSILHEFGHLQQGSGELKDVLADPSREYSREKDAWDKAEVEVLKYPRFALAITDFYTYRNEALSSYHK